MYGVERMKKQRVLALSAAIVLGVIAVMLICNPVWASSASGTISSILQDMIDIIGMVFTAVGIILAIYSVGTLILAFKNDDPDSKQRASTMLVVAVVLIGFPAIIDQLNLTSYLKTSMVFLHIRSLEQVTDVGTADIYGHICLQHTFDDLWRRHDRRHQ